MLPKPRQSITRTAYFEERFGEVRRITLPCPPVNRAAGSYLHYSQTTAEGRLRKGAPRVWPAEQYACERMEELPQTIGKDRARRRARARCGGRCAGGGEAAQRRALLGRRRTRPLLPRLPPCKRARLLLRLPC